MSTAGPRYLSAFHQYEGQEVEQHAHKMHCRVDGSQGPKCVSLARLIREK
jgi:hypothetical protein